MSAKRNYLFRFLVPHLKGAGDYSTLFHRLEETPFLSQQAEFFDSFAEGSSNLEEQVLPVTIELRDWRRFAHYFLIAVNIRGLVRSFMDRGTLEAIIERHRIGFLLDAVAGADVHHRLLLRALAIRRLAKEEDQFQSLLRKIREDLRSLPLPRGEQEAERQFWVLFTVGKEVGPEVEAELHELLSAGREGWAEKIWAAVAEGCLERGGILDPGFWGYLEEFHDEEGLAAVLPDLFADEEVAASREALERVAALSTSDIRILRLCWAALVGRIAKTAPDNARLEWDRMARAGHVEWSLELVERARDLFTAADAAWIEQAVEQADDPGTAAALRVFSASRGDAMACTRAAETIDRLPQGSDRIHWTLRLLETGSAPDLPERLHRVAGSLQRLRFAVPADDLRRFLDLVAAVLPHKVERFLEEIVWAPSTGLDVLMTLAQKSERPALLEPLLANVDTYLAGLGPSEVDGYWALKELVPQAAGRLCALRGDLVHLEAALQRSPDQDEARVTIAKSLAAAGHRQLAQDVCEGIRSKRLRLRILFELVPDSACETYLKDPATLYSSLAEADVLEDVGLGLMSLLDPGRSLTSLHETYFRRIAGENEQVLAAIRRVRLALDQPRRYGWSARDAALGAETLAHAASSLGSDAQLAFLTPDLLEIWGRIDPAQACEELRESLSQILGLHFLTPENREDAVEVLLSRMHLLLFPPSAKAPPRSRFRDAAALIVELAEQLAAPPDGADSASGRNLLPILVAAAARLPRPALESLGYRGLLRLLEAGRGPDSLQDGRIRALSCALQEDPREALAQWLETTDDAEPAALVGLIYLLAVRHPDLALEAIDLLSPNASRDGLCRRLVCYGWLPEDAARQALELIEDPLIRLESELHLGARSVCGAGAETWVGQLARLAVEKDVDCSDPRSEMLVRCLWSIASDGSDVALAHAARAALAGGDPFRAWGAFYLWLHSLLSPLPAEKSPERLRLASDLLAALPRSLRLPSPSGSPETGALVSGV